MADDRLSLLARVRGLGGALAGLVGTRVDLACVEVEEERLHLAGLLLWSVATLFWLAMGLLAVGAWVVLLAWQQGQAQAGLMALAVLSGLYLLVALVCAGVWRRKRQLKTPLLQATRAELRADAAALLGRAP
jgi:uncharacterized membrane protein YqjE